MVIRSATILFAACILQVAGVPAAHILLAGATGILQVVGPPATHKASNINADAPLIDQLLESLNVAGCSRLGRLARAALMPHSDMPGFNSRFAKPGIIFKS